jgi:hypothetical protein
MPARVADSGIVLVAATHHDPAEDKIGDHGSANVWGSAGNMGGESTATTTDASTQILNFTHNLATKTIVAALDLSFTVRAAQGQLGALRVPPRKSVLHGAFVWVRRALNSRKRRFAKNSAGQWSPDWNGGSMNSGPGGRRARFTGIDDFVDGTNIFY